MAGEIGWRVAECYALWNQAFCFGPQGAYERALECTIEAIAIAEETEHRAWMCASLVGLGAIQCDLLALNESAATLEEALLIAHECGSMFWIRVASGLLGRSLVPAGRLDRAQEVLDAALTPDAPADTVGSRIVLAARAELLLARKRPAEALAVLDRLTAGLDSADPALVPSLARLRAGALAQEGEHASAVQIAASTADRARERGTRSGLWLVYADLATYYQALGERDKAREAHRAATDVIDSLAAQLGDERREAFRTSAMARLPALRSPTQRQAAKEASGGLTEREREIAGLVAAGMSNAAIGEELVISERTVETHVTNILAKLGFASRAQIAAWATERGLST
jgi:non-specific serine/threonine protein kinase